MPPGVVGVTWQWVSFTTPAEQVNVDTRERYTIQFDQVGRLAVRADCNRGGASYAVTPDRRVTLGAMALTRAACPPGSLSDRFAREVGRAASYFLKDDELFLELPANSGTLRFERQR
jgi:para-nitrobenzyl esterase